MLMQLGYWVTGINRIKCFLENQEVVEWGLSVEETREVKERMERWISTSRTKNWCAFHLWHSTMRSAEIPACPTARPKSTGHWLWSQTSCVHPCSVAYTPEPQLCPPENGAGNNKTCFTGFLWRLKYNKEPMWSEAFSSAPATEQASNKCAGQLLPSPRLMPQLTYEGA